MALELREVRAIRLKGRCKVGLKGKCVSARPTVLSSLGRDGLVMSRVCVSSSFDRCWWSEDANGLEGFLFNVQCF